MRIVLNPFLVSAVVALVVLVAIVVISHRRNETRVRVGTREQGATTAPSGPTTLASVLALAVVLVPFGIAVAALWGPSAGIVAYPALFAGSLIALAVSRRSHRLAGREDIMIGRRSTRWAVLLLLLLASCGSGGGAGTAEKTYAPEQLEPVLLTAAEVGPGWTEQDRQMPTTASSSSVSVPSSSSERSTSFCPAVGTKLAEFERRTSDQLATSVVLSSPDATEARPVGVIEKLWSVDEATALFGDMKAALPNCIGQTWTTSDGEQLTLAPMTGLPTIGDESFSFLATASEPTRSGNVEWYLPTTIARFGSVIAILEGLDIHDTGAAPTLTVPQLNNIFTTAARKIESLPR